MSLRAFTNAFLIDCTGKDPMEGAAVVGNMVDRAKAALEAGCDVLSLCNNRQGVLQVIDSFRGSGDPLSQVRMARLHGKPGISRETLQASLEWRTCEAAVKSSMDRPNLSLDA